MRHFGGRQGIQKKIAFAPRKNGAEAIMLQFNTLLGESLICLSLNPFPF